MTAVHDLLSRLSQRKATTPETGITSEGNASYIKCKGNCAKRDDVYMCTAVKMDRVGLLEHRYAALAAKMPDTLHASI